MGHKFTSLLIVVAGMGVLFVALVLLRAVVLKDLWGWFVVPLGVPGIGMAHAVGISTIASLLTSSPTTSRKDEKDTNKFADGISVLILSGVLSLFAWGIGAVVHLYMG